MFDALGSDAVVELRDDRELLKKTLLNHVSRGACLLAVGVQNVTGKRANSFLAHMTFESKILRSKVTCAVNRH